MFLRKPTRAHRALDSNHVQTRIVAFIQQRAPLAAALPFDADTRLFSSGLLDSLGFVDLVAFVDRELGVTLGDRANVDMRVLDRLGDVVSLVAGP